MATFARTFLRCSSTAALIAAIFTTCCPGAHAQDKKKHADEAPAIPSYYGPQPATEDIDLTMYARIRAEGFTHSKVMQFGAALADGIGPRLTGSPNMAKANAWTRDTLTAVGLENAHLEDWGEFGMGWQQINTWARMVSPDPEPLWMQAAPWSPATKGAVSGPVVYVPLVDEAELEKLKGTLAGKIVLLGAMRATPDITEALFKRYTDAELEAMKETPVGTDPQLRRYLNGQTMEQFMAARRKTAELKEKALKMMLDEGVLAIITPSRDGGDGGGNRHHLRRQRSQRQPRCAEGRDHAVKIPNAVMMIEHYNRLARMTQAKVPVTVEVNIDTKFTGDHEHGFDTVAEIPGNRPQAQRPGRHGRRPSR